jgi:hypothetical protein
MLILRELQEPALSSFYVAFFLVLSSSEADLLWQASVITSSRLLITFLVYFEELFTPLGHFITLVSITLLFIFILCSRIFHLLCYTFHKCLRYNLRDDSSGLPLSDLLCECELLHALLPPLLVCPEVLLEGPLAVLREPRHRHTYR